MKKIESERIRGLAARLREDGEYEGADHLEELLAEIERLTPEPSSFENMKSVVYRDLDKPLTTEMYDEAIEDLRNAQQMLIEGPTSAGCLVCGGECGPNSCHHNPLLLARKWARATRIWQCYHCGFTATNDAEGREHFGYSDTEMPACLR